MKIQKLKLTNFRCFKDSLFVFDKPIVVIEGNNGSGKTSLLEALHYACYLRSFRTRIGKELVSFEGDHFFIHVDVEGRDLLSQSIQIGFSKNTKVVKLNKKSINSYKELISNYRVIATTEDDLELVRGAPENRRYFLDQALALEIDDYVETLKAYKLILNNRNSLLFKNRNLKSDSSNLKVWTEQLCKRTEEIQACRIIYLENLEIKLNELGAINFFNDSVVNLSYMPKLTVDKVDSTIIEGEIREGRTLFGAHLDDFTIIFKEHGAKRFASRGQQKLVLFLLKIAQFQMLQEKGIETVLLLDDFLTDLDRPILEKCLKLLISLSCQTFITCPIKSFITANQIPDFDPLIISL